MANVKIIPLSRLDQERLMADIKAHVVGGGARDQAEFQAAVNHELEEINKLGGVESGSLYDQTSFWGKLDGLLGGLQHSRFHDLIHKGER